MTTLVLASQSPRRQNLLKEAGLHFLVRPADVREERLPGEAPEAMVLRLAVEKAATIAAVHPDALVLGADTVVALDGEIFGKPADMADARRMIEALSGRTHVVYTGVCLYGPKDALRSWVSTTRVSFRLLSADAIDRYLSDAKPLDKAGAYAIQEHGGNLVACFDGLYSNVVGLPMEDLLKYLR